MPGERFVCGDAFALPFPDDSFERLFTGHLYPPEHERFLAEARRVADELVVVDAALRRTSKPKESKACAFGRFAPRGIQEILHGRGSR